MSIEFHGLSFVAECDFCSETHDTDKDRDDGFQAAVDVIKAKGWKVFRDRGFWFHKCPCCQQDAFEDISNDD